MYHVASHFYRLVFYMGIQLGGVANKLVYYYCSYYYYSYYYYYYYYYYYKQQLIRCSSLVSPLTRLDH